MFGITSACAEQTVMVRASLCVGWDHLRVCGADDTSGVEPLIIRGSPPRVRSRQGHVLPRGRGEGITSACAEQTVHIQ